MAEGAPLLREYRLIPYRGFESLSLRHTNKGPLGSFFMRNQRTLLGPFGCVGFEPSNAYKALRHLGVSELEG